MSNKVVLPRALYAPPGIVGRAQALSRIQSCLEKMLGGERQIVFVAGEAGMARPLSSTRSPRGSPLIGTSGYVAVNVWNGTGRTRLTFHCWMLSGGCAGSSHSCRRAARSCANVAVANAFAGECFRARGAGSRSVWSNTRANAARDG